MDGYATMSAAAFCVVSRVISGSCSLVISSIFSIFFFRWEGYLQAVLRAVLCKYYYYTPLTAFKQH